MKIIPDAASLRIIVPGFRAAWENARAAGMSRPLASLERIVRRGTLKRVARNDLLLHGWQLALLDALGLECDSAYALAALEWLGSGGELLQGSWLRAEFVHVEVGTHAARLHEIEPVSSSAAALRDALTAHFAESGFSLKVAPGGDAAMHFYLHSPGSLEAECFLPAFDATDVRERLPQGADGGRLRRLFTEAQMLLHEHPVNSLRERQRLRTVNAIWLSGAGVFDTLRPAALPALWSDDPWVRGLARLHAAEIHSLEDAHALIQGGCGMAVLPLVAGPDPTRTLQEFELNWIAPLVTALQARKLAQLFLSLDDLEIRIDRSALRRFWPRGQPLAEWFS